MPIHYLSVPEIKIDGSDAPEGLIEDIIEIALEESLHQPGMFTLVIRNDYFPGRSPDTPWRYDNLFAIGKSIKIAFSASTTLSPEFKPELTGDVFEGEIAAMEVFFNSDAKSTIIIRGYDVSHRLHRGRYNRSFQNVTDSDIVNRIVSEVGITTGTVSKGAGPHDYVFQENQTNMEFLRERAARVGYELYVQGGKLNFHEPKAGDSLNLKWLEDIHSFRIRVSSSQQVSEVEVHGWDYTKKQPIVSKSTSGQAITKTQHGEGKTTSSAFKGKPPTPKMIVVDRPVFTSDEATKMASGLFKEIAGEFVHADATGDGDPRIRPGKVVKIQGIGNYSGSYYITESRHFYRDRVYSTEFSVRGLRGGELPATVSPQNRLRPGQTLLVGIVTNNTDPKKWGRVRVKFPTLTPEDDGSAHASNWARVVGIGGGPARGFDCLPEINDEVLVAFEHGDIHRPYVIGGVWNGTDAPPESVDNSVASGQVRLRTFKTRTGHKLQFVEEDKDTSKAGAYIETKGTHKFQMNDSDKFVETKTTNGHYARLDDRNKKIEIKSTGGHQILIDDNSKKIQIKTRGGHHVVMNDLGKTIEIKSTNGQKLVMNDMGNSISMEALQTISIKAPLEIKLQSGASIVKLAPTGIEFQTPTKLSGQAGTAVEFQTAGTATVRSGAAMSLQSGMSMTVQAGASLNIQSGAALNMQAGAAAALLAGVTASVTAPLIRLNC